METFVELLMLKKEGGFRFSVSIILFEISKGLKALKEVFSATKKTQFQKYNLDLDGQLVIDPEIHN